MSCSAKTGANIEELFDLIGERALRDRTPKAAEAGASSSGSSIGGAKRPSASSSSVPATASSSVAATGSTTVQLTSTDSPSDKDKPSKCC